jgi:hypothetical protein
LVREGIRDLRARRVDGILLACTEFPLALDAAELGPDEIDPLDHLAEAAVRAAIAESTDGPPDRGAADQRGESRHALAISRLAVSQMAGC